MRSWMIGAAKSVTAGAAAIPELLFELLLEELLELLDMLTDNDF